MISPTSASTVLEANLEIVIKLLAAGPGIVIVPDTLPSEPSVGTAVTVAWFVKTMSLSIFACVTVCCAVHVID